MTVTFYRTHMNYGEGNVFIVYVPAFNRLAGGLGVGWGCGGEGVGGVGNSNCFSQNVVKKSRNFLFSYFTLDWHMGATSLQMCKEI